MVDTHQDPVCHEIKRIGSIVDEAGPITASVTVPAVSQNIIYTKSENTRGFFHQLGTQTIRSS